MLNKELLSQISNIKELYQELKFTSVGTASNKNIFKYISTTNMSKVSNKLAIYENNTETNQNLFALNIANNSEYNICGNLEKFPSVNFYNCRWLETVELPEILWNYSSNNYETDMSSCFYSCTNLTTAPNIPNNVTDMSSCFYTCTNLTTAPNIPDSVTYMSSCFNYCTNLTTAPNIPDSVIDMSNCFYRCGDLTTAPEYIGNSVTNMSNCFFRCNRLAFAPNIPNSVTDMSNCFSFCSELAFAPNIPNSVTNMSSCFLRCSFTATPVIPDSVINMSQCFSGCRGLTLPSDIPNSVIDMGGCFSSCRNLTGTMNILSTEITDINKCFYSHSNSSKYPLNIYIYTHYDNGVQTTTYNTFLNDTSHDGSGWQLGVPKLGITLKDINDKPNSNISIFIDSTQGKKGSEIYFIPYSSTGEPQSERIDIEYDTWYKYPVNIGDYYVFDGKPSTQARAPEAGELNFYPIDMINCNYEEYYFEHHVTITGQNAVFTAYTD